MGGGGGGYKSVCGGEGGGIECMLCVYKCVCVCVCVVIRSHSLWSLGQVRSDSVV